MILANDLQIAYLDNHPNVNRGPYEVTAL
ncbi:uncharacterized protein METZ01_LOCUS344893, partial [marine metagenome]